MSIAVCVCAATMAAAPLAPAEAPGIRPTAFRSLALGSVRAERWLLKQLELPPAREVHPMRLQPVGATELRIALFPVARRKND